MKTAPKFGKRPNPQALKAAQTLDADRATVREWLGPHASADTVNRLAYTLQRRAAA